MYQAPLRKPGNEVMYETATASSLHAYLLPCYMGLLAQVCSEPNVRDIHIAY